MIIVVALLLVALAILVVGGAVSIVLVRGLLALGTRKLDLEERTVAVQEQRAKGVKPPAAIPPDLMRRVLRWGDLDAQAAERKVLLDLYTEFATDSKSEEQTWIEVRQHLPRELSETDDPGARELFVA